MKHEAIQTPRSTAEDSWAVHQAPILAEGRNPALADNPRWLRVRRAAFIDFKTELERA